MRRILVVLALCCAVVLLAAQTALATTINFDDVASGTDIATQYSGQGVTFSCVSCSLGAGPSVYTDANPSAASGPNVVTLFSGSPGGAFFDARYGGIEATFATAQSTVSIDAMGVPPAELLSNSLNRPFLEAFDASNNFLGEVLYPYYEGQAGFGSWSTLSFTSSSANIAYVIFSSQHSQDGYITYGMFDNLTFDTGGGGTNVPEPASITLLGAGLIGLLAKRRAGRS